MEASQRQSWAATFAFRFAFIYIATYLVTAPPVLTGPINRLLHAIVSPVYGLFADAAQLPPPQGSTGNNFAMAMAALLLATVGAPLWCALQRSTAYDARLHLWLRWATRYFILGVMVIYGVAKVVQFGAPPLSGMLQPIGSLTPMNMLWLFMGTSKTYTLFAGVAEVTGGMLMISRRTTTLGALVCIGVMTNVWLMNLLYDVPVKVLSLHLLLLSVFLLLPDLRRMLNVFALNRPTEPAGEPPLFTSPLLVRAGNILRALLVLGVISFGVFLSWAALQARPVSPLYGIWVVEQFESDGVARPPLVTDEARWRRVVFDLPQVMAVQRMNDQVERYSCRVDLPAKSLKLTKFGDKQWSVDFTAEQSGGDTLLLAGSFDDEQLKLRLRRVPTPDFPLARLKFR